MLVKASSQLETQTQPDIGARVKKRSGRRLGINRLCSATFEQPFCSVSNLEQLLPPLATFEQQISVKMIQTIKKGLYLEGVFFIKSGQN